MKVDISNALRIKPAAPRFQDGRPLFIGDTIQHRQFAMDIYTVTGMRRDDDDVVWVAVEGYVREFKFSEPRSGTYECYWRLL